MLDLESLGPFPVLRFPYQFDGDPVQYQKLWLVALVIQGVVACLKPTSKSENYKEPDRLAGVVHYAAGELSFFTEETFISPERYPISYAHLERCYRNNTLTFEGNMPSDFREKMLRAAGNVPVTRVENFSDEYTLYHSSPSRYVTDEMFRQKLKDCFGE